MAVTVLTSTQAKFNNVTGKTLVAPTAQADGFEFVPVANDEQTILIVRNGNAGAQNVTIKAPTNKHNYSAIADKVVSLGIGNVALIAVESAKYKDVATGRIKVVTGAVDVTAALFHLKGQI